MAVVWRQTGFLDSLSSHQRDDECEVKVGAGLPGMVGSCHMGLCALFSGCFESRGQASPALVDCHQRHAHADRSGIGLVCGTWLWPILLGVFRVSRATGSLCGRIIGAAMVCDSLRGAGCCQCAPGCSRIALRIAGREPFGLLWQSRECGSDTAFAGFRRFEPQSRMRKRRRRCALPPHSKKLALVRTCLENSKTSGPLRTKTVHWRRARHPPSIRGITSGAPRAG